MSSITFDEKLETFYSLVMKNYLPQLVYDVNKNNDLSKVPDLLDTIAGCKVQLFNEQKDPEAVILALSTMLSEGRLDLFFKKGKVEVRPSPVNGKGVFATQDIKKGEIITFYPLHDVGFKVEKHLYKYTTDNRDWIKRYLFGDLDTIHLIGNPKKTRNCLFLGHMINDPLDHLDTSNFEKFVFRYFLCSSTRSNAKFETIRDHWVSIDAVRDIKAGEEIFVPYGIQYWFDEPREKVLERLKNLVDSLPAQKRALFFSLINKISAAQE